MNRADKYKEQLKRESERRHDARIIELNKSAKIIRGRRRKEVISSSINIDFGDLK